MRAQNSPLKLKRIHTVGCSFEFDPKNSGTVDTYRILESYGIDVELDHWQNEDETLFYNSVSVHINEDGSQIGYKISYSVVGEFEIEDEESLQKSEVWNLRFTAVFAILVSYLRAKMQVLTCDAPMGPYVLPSINIRKLIDEKAKEQIDQMNAGAHTSEGEI